jgi:hypothetical protein
MTYSFKTAVNGLSCVDGQEAINFQRNSKLSQGLIDIFDEVFNYIKDYDKVRIITNKNIEQRHTAIVKYFKNTTIPQLKSHIKKETNITIKQIITIAPENAQGLFAIDLSLDNIEDVIDAKDTLTGEKSYKDIKSTNSLDELLSVAEDFDPANSKLSTGKISKEREVFATIYFDVGSAFLMNELTPNIESLTSEEITAIMMHEIGHMMSFIENINNMTYLGQYVTNSVNNLTDSKDLVSQFHKNYKVLKAKINELGKSKAISNKVENLLNKALDVVYYFDKENKNRFIGNAIKLLIGSTIKIIILIILFATKRAVFLRFVATIYSQIFTYHLVSSYIVTKGLKQKEKTGDDIFTSRNKYYFERIADEFVSRHGMGSYLATGLQKIISFMNTLQATSGVTTSPELATNKLVKYYLVTMTFVNNASALDTEISCSGYEVEIDRIGRLLENNMAAFKNRDLPNNVKDRYIKDTEQLMVALKVSKSQVDKTISKVVSDYLLMIRSGDILYETLRTGRLSKDMEKLLNKMDRLINNKLYYYSAKFGQLSRH